MRYQIMRGLFLIIGLVAGLIGRAQKHDNNWIFGGLLTSNLHSGGVRMYFDEGYPLLSLENIKCNYSGYAIVCSDSTGQLLFHTNGISIRNRLHNVMPGGSVINPGSTWINFQNTGYPNPLGGVAIPAPGLPNHYYLFHTSSTDDVGAISLFPIIYYTLIDMSQNNGLGAVISANNIVAQGELPSVAAVKHGNGRDWWVIAGDNLHKTYATFLITPDGVHILSDQSITPDAFSDQSGYIKFSQDGSKFVAFNPFEGLFIYDFDRCSGQLSNPRKLPFTYPPFYTMGMVFSADDRYLYLQRVYDVYQLDMQTIDNVSVELNTISFYDGGLAPFPTYFFFPELGPDNKIYYETWSSTLAYHVMNRPNLPWQACDLSQQGLTLTRYRNGTWCDFPNYRLGRLEDSPCDTISYRSPADTQFSHIPWSGVTAQKVNEPVKILQFPPGFQVAPLRPGEEKFMLESTPRGRAQKMRQEKH